MCDDGYDGDDCSTVTNKDYMIDYIIDNFDRSDVDDKSWLQVTGGVIRDTCVSEPNSKSLFENMYIIVVYHGYRGC